jgi:pimeloyl-ACP methyl ester carboxylesterase
VARDRAEPYGAVGRSEWLDVDWQEHLRWVRVQERWMNMVDMGPTESAAAAPEEPIIFIHGLSGCWQNWLEQIPHFARDRRVIAVDLPGFGQSEMPAEEISISGYADAIDALMDELDVETAQIVGNSPG